MQAFPTSTAEGSGEILGEWIAILHTGVLYFDA